MKKVLAILLCAALLLTMLAACGGTASSTAAPASSAAPAEEEDEENYETGDASLDKVRNEDGIGPNELMVVSFGTSFNDSRRLTIGAIEQAVEDAFPSWSVRRGFTSQIIIDHVKSRDGIAIDNFEEAMDRAVKNGVRSLVVQPTHLMNGFEYNDVVDAVAQYADAFYKLAVGAPLLTTDEDFDRVADIIIGATKEYDDGKTAICFMGHGTEADSNGVYAKMQTVLDKKGAKNYFIGTVEAEPSVEDVLEAVKKGSYTRVVLEPLMIVAGDHANNDMAGDEEDSWKSIFEGAGYEVKCILRGLGELTGIQELIVEHAQEAMDGLDEDYDTGDASLDKVRNEDGIGQAELMVVSFGTSFNNSRRQTIGAIEQAVEDAFPNWSIRRGFTSQIIIDHVKDRDGIAIDNFEEAMERAVKNGVRAIVIQPTHLMDGFEYNDVVNAAAQYADAFDELVIGKPLLNTDEDFSRIADIIIEATKEYDDGKTAICFMGHGTEAASNGVYAKMQTVLEKKGAKNYYIGTVEAEPSVEDVLEAVKKGEYTRVVLEPLMIVAGDHANNDMAGDEEDSWKSIFEGAGYEVKCILRGLGELEGIQQMIVDHAKEVIAEMEEDYTTGDASLDKIRNEDGIGENELMVVSFGTSFNNSRRLTIGAIEAAMEKAFPDWSIRRGFTSQIIIDHVKDRDGIAIDNFEEAMDRAVKNNVKKLVVQPTHLMDGFEYNDVVNAVAQYADAFEKLEVGAPLLTSDEDFSRVADIIIEATKSYDDGKTAICFMGHGTEAASNGVYAKMQTVLDGKGAKNYFIGTVEAEPSVEDVIAAVKKGDYTRVVLEPLMIVAGDHANNDMAGDEEDSWKTLFESEGYEVECILRGLGELEGIQQMIVEHAKAAIDQLG